MLQLHTVAASDVISIKLSTGEKKNIGDAIWLKKSQFWDEAATSRRKGNFFKKQHCWN